MIPGDTIVAPATPFGFSGLAIVRISGKNALYTVRKLTGNSKKKTPFLPRVATLSTLYSSNNNPFDDAVITFFPGPNSYTGEDLVEISSHGNPAIVEEVLAVALHYGARMAEPGEFTRRAFLNGKMDLAQAEAVASIIHAQSLESSRLSYRVLHGALSNRLSQIKNILVGALSEIEFELDISEEDTDPLLAQKIDTHLANLIHLVSELLEAYQQSRLLTQGALVVIAGKPNVGKSTLLNTLSSTDRAITSHLPGTTRDAVDISLLMDGVSIRLVDTAGLRETQEEIEQEGVRRAHKYFKDADLVLSVIDSKNDVFYHHPSSPVIKVFNKTDLCSELLREKDVIHVSAKYDKGIKVLRKAIKKNLGISGALSANALLTSSRQRDILSTCLESLNRLQDLTRAEQNLPLEIVALELRFALDAVDQILGKTTPEDILNNIFSAFCVGK